MRTIRNLVGGLLVAATLAVSATPALADQKVTVTGPNGGKMCIILTGVAANAPNDSVRAILNAVLDRLGCDGI